MPFFLVKDKCNGLLKTSPEKAIAWPCGLRRMEEEEEEDAYFQCNGQTLLIS